jgi:hypothetical protein
VFEVVRATPPYDTRGFTVTYRDAILRALESTPGAKWDVWQIADDDLSTRVCLWAELAAENERRS